MPISSEQWDELSSYISLPIAMINRTRKIPIDAYRPEQLDSIKTDRYLPIILIDGIGSIRIVSNEMKVSIPIGAYRPEQ